MRTLHLTMVYDVFISRDHITPWRLFVVLLLFRSLSFSFSMDDRLSLQRAFVSQETIEQQRREREEAWRKVHANEGKLSSFIDIFIERNLKII
jgi:hypothetical protein